MQKKRQIGREKQCGGKSWQSRRRWMEKKMAKNGNGSVHGYKCVCHGFYNNFNKEKWN